MYGKLASNTDKLILKSILTIHTIQKNSTTADLNHNTKKAPTFHLPSTSISLDCRFLIR